jgi:hypothetical protein
VAAGAAVVLVLAVTALYRLRTPSQAAPSAAEGTAEPTASNPAVAVPVVAQPAPPPKPTTAAALPTPSTGREVPVDEPSCMAQLRSVKDSNPALAIDLARDCASRFPDSTDGAERASILIHALAAEGRHSEARGEAEHAVNYYPDSSWVREIEGFTGAHRHRNLRFSDSGAIEFY